MEKKKRHVTSEEVWLDQVASSNMDTEIEVPPQDGYDRGEIERLLADRDRKHQEELESKDAIYQDLEKKFMSHIENLKADLEEMGEFSSPAFYDNPSQHFPKNNGANETKQHIDLPLLPNDVFSFLAFAKPTTTSMLAAVIVIIIQGSTLSLLAYDILSHGSPGNWIGAPVRVSTPTSIIQVLAMFIGVFSQTDFQESLNSVLLGYNENEMKYHFGSMVTKPRWLFCHSMRIFVSALGLAVMYCLIVGESDSTELLLNFTAIEFVTSLDNIFFWLCAWGYMGLRAQQDATRVVTAHPCHLVVVKRGLPNRESSNGDGRKGGLKRSRSRRGLKRNKSLKIIPSLIGDTPVSSFLYSKSTVKGKLNQSGKGSSVSSFSESEVPESEEATITQSADIRDKETKDCRFQFLVLIFLLEFCGWAYILYQQKIGAYLCQTIFVQFHDDILPEMAAFSGLYEFEYFNLGCNDEASCARGQYLEKSRNVYDQVSLARFGYCKEERTWVFSKGENLTTTGRSQYSPICDWEAKASEMDPLSEDSFDIMKTATARWFIKNQRKVVVPEGIVMKCFDCDREDICGEDDGRGECVNNRCECNEGYHGLFCEFDEPCTNIQVDDLSPPFQTAQEWPSEYKALRNTDDINSAIVEAYNRPVYISTDDSIPGIIFFNGRRWAIAKPSDIDYEGKEAEEFFSKIFHAYWSDYKVGFYSEPVDVDTPDDSNSPGRVKWYEATFKHEGEIQAPDESKPADSTFLCSACSNETNPCEFEGVCMQDGKCDCIKGSSGTLCQIPPTGNGFCDEYFNTLNFNWDGGDCCEDTCIDSAEYRCGFGIVTANGTSGLTYVGYNNCQDPEVAAQIEGSKTLYRIMERGYVICGVYLSTIPGYEDFCLRQCTAIAAALFGDTEGPIEDRVQLEFWSNDRFNRLNNLEFDIVFGSDFTASRDIFEASSQSPFYYASLPYLFTGLAFAGKSPYGFCADKLEFSAAECQGLKICIEAGTTFAEFVQKTFPPDMVLVIENNALSKIDGLNDGLCNVIGGYPYDLSFQNVAASGYLGSEEEYEAGSSLHIKSFETWITREDDRKWNKFVSWVFESLVQAEEANVSKDTADELMATTDVFGPNYSNMFRYAVKAVGTYSDLWGDFDFTRAGLNGVNDGTTGIMLAMDLGNYEDIGPDPVTDGKIEQIRTLKKELRCGVIPRAGFAFEKDGIWTGLEVDICKGIAAALFNGEAKVFIFPVDTYARWTSLVTGEADLYFGFTKTLEREVKYSVADNEAFDMTPAYFHDGLVFSGPMPYGKCAEDLEFTEGACVNTKICVVAGTTWDNVIRNTLKVPEANIYPVDTFSDAFKAHISGDCNVIAGELSYITRENLENEGYNFDNVDYHYGSIKYSKEPLVVMSSSEDPQFSDFLRWIIYAFIHGEERGISEGYNMPKVNLFGEDMSRMWQHAIAEAGNYEDMYERNLGALIPREGLNKLNDLLNPGPQLYSAPGTLN